jgi:D-alanyl-D-alanine carboxypeptidase
VSGVQLRLGRPSRSGLIFLAIFVFVMLPLAAARAAPYAAMVIDARTGEVVHSRNADTRLHPASLTKMMTLYIAFEAIERGQISLDTPVKISANAASEPPSKLGLKAGQRIRRRYLIRAAAVKSANDAATAIGEAIEGSEAAFARRMNRTAKALGMSRSTFKNAHGLTEDGHLSTARDMTILGRHLLYDHPEYYNLFSRSSVDVGGRTVNNTNRKLLASYRGADGIKTGYTRAAGFNLVASAERGDKRVIATMFGGSSGAARNARVAELLDMGFGRVPRNVAEVEPPAPNYAAVSLAVQQSLRPAPNPRRARSVADSLPPQAVTPGAVALALTEATTTPVLPARPDTDEAVGVALLSTSPETEEDVDEMTEVLAAALADAAPTVPVSEGSGALRPRARPAGEGLLAAIADEPVPSPVEEVAATAAPAQSGPEVVTRLSTSGGRHWSINVGQYGSRYEAERVLLQTALGEIETLDEALRKVVHRPTGFEANFIGLSEPQAQLACARLNARNRDCTAIGPS